MTASWLHPVVVKVGGKAIDDPAALAQVAEGLAAAAQEQAIVVVHGGGVAVDRRLAASSPAPPRRIAGLRVTPPAAMEIIAEVLGREVNSALVQAINDAGQRAVGLTLDKALATCALQRGPEGEDLGRVGQVTGGDPGAIRALLAEGVMPVIACIGRDADGPLNINADSAAAGVARFCEAEMVALLTDTPGVLDASGAVIPELDAAAIESLVASGVIHSGMIPKVRAALEVAEVAQAPVVIASWGNLLAPEGQGAGASDGRGRRVANPPHSAPGTNPPHSALGGTLVLGRDGADGRRRPTGAASP